MASRNSLVAAGWQSIFSLGWDKEHTSGGEAISNGKGRKRLSRNMGHGQRSHETKALSRERRRTTLGSIAASQHSSAGRAMTLDDFYITNLAVQLQSTVFVPSHIHTRPSSHQNDLLLEHPVHASPKYHSTKWTTQTPRTRRPDSEQFPQPGQTCSWRCSQAANNASDDLSIPLCTILPLEMENRHAPKPIRAAANAQPCPPIPC
ncbi:hypothetical protein BKA65DRAFT_54773 [Rhexocercosporidium sp. MPI-PUGE-AT-0058]|nr:hypothetical protein BKA65DRAFT_54773 [Rhexocercosporidium sp. MPI-PUGE-AT-0058]